MVNVVNLKWIIYNKINEVKIVYENDKLCYNNSCKVKGKIIVILGYTL